MIRIHYALPIEERGCNAVEFREANLRDGFLAVQPGTATLEGGNEIEVAPGVYALMGASVVEGTFVSADPEVGRQTMQIDAAAFDAWYAEQTPDANDGARQQLVSGLMRYAWLARHGLLPNE